MSRPTVQADVVGRRRQAVLVLVLTVLLVFGGRLVWVQAVEGDELAEQARNVRLSTSVVEAPRGDILDADGELLATSVERYNVGVNQRLVADYVEEDEDGEVVASGATAAARALAPLLGQDAAELGARMVGDSTFVYLARGLTPEEWQEVAALRIPGIEPERASERIYPNGTTAGNVLGYVGRDDEGLAGLERAFDDALTGTPGKLVREIGRTGQVIPTGTREDVPARPGETLHTTIDRDLQFHAQQVIDETVEEYSAEWGAVVVQEVATGRVVALADSGAVDPNDYQEWEPEERGSRAVVSPVEPGSTGKLPTFAAALDAGVVEPDTVFEVSSSMTTPNGQRFSDSYDRPTADRTAAGILANSSNTGTIQIGSLLDDRTRYEYLRAFGLGEPTGIEIRGESPGVLRDPDTWDGRTRYATMFGQALSVTLLQNTSVVATLGNDGVRLPSRLVDGLTGDDGVFHPVEQPEGRQVVGAEAAQDLVAMMEGVVSGEGGTGVLGKVDGYRVGAKTGTAQIVGDSGGLTERASSFVGLAPVEDPRFAVGVVVYKPEGNGFGSLVGGPVFREVMEFALHQAAVPPSTTPPAGIPLAPDDPLGLDDPLGPDDPLAPEEG